MPPRIQSISIGNPDLMSTTWNPSDVKTPVPTMFAMTMNVAVQNPIFAGLLVFKPGSLLQLL